jgi:hypothetical protein
MVLGMKQKAKKSYIDKDKGPTEEQLERRNLIKGRLFEDEDDQDIDFFIPTKRGAGESVSLERSTKPKARRSIGLSSSQSCRALQGKPKEGKNLSLKRNTKPKAKTQSCQDLQTMRLQSRKMADAEAEEKATPMEKAMRRVRERKALEKGQSDASVLFANRKSIQEQDASTLGILSRGLKVLESLYEDCA